MSPSARGAPESKGRTAWRGQIVLAFVLGLCGCLGWHQKQPNGDLLDDKVITARVEQALKTHPGYDFSNVHVSTSGGGVTLSGSVHTPREKTEAGELARSVDLVKSVKDEIQVKP
ncbi:putative phospholipid-binding domain protein [Verrucomicrobia bacterium]|nr:putative phospholipid-binding domain protein [Verrucomicrobiota bacterium]